MARPVSSILQSKHLKAIESALLDGVPQRKIAAKFGVSLPAVSRHFSRVVKPTLSRLKVTVNKVYSPGVHEVYTPSKSEQVAEMRQQGTAALVQKRLYDYDRILAKAEKTGDLGAWSSVDKAETAKLRLMAELSGELQPQAPTTAAIVLLLPQQAPAPAQDQRPEDDAIDADWTPG